MLMAVGKPHSSNFSAQSTNSVGAILFMVKVFLFLISVKSGSAAQTVQCTSEILEKHLNIFKYNQFYVFIDIHIINILLTYLNIFEMSTNEAEQPAQPPVLFLYFLSHCPLMLLHNVGREMTLVCSMTP